MDNHFIVLGLFIHIYDLIQFDLSGPFIKKMKSHDLNKDITTPSIPVNWSVLFGQN